jgi:hypothetical protein
MMRAVIVCLSALIGAFTATACESVSEAKTPVVTVAGPEVRGGEWFKKTGCIDCHSMSVYRILNLTAIAPDLSIAVEDVPHRFGMSLDDFFQAPTGTMSMVLSSRIPLTPEHRALAVSRLKEAYREHQEAAGIVRPIASH